MGTNCHSCTGWLKKTQIQRRRRDKEIPAIDQKTGSQIGKWLERIAHAVDSGHMNEQGLLPIQKALGDRGEKQRSDTISFPYSIYFTSDIFFVVE